MAESIIVASAMSFLNCKVMNLMGGLLSQFVGLYYSVAFSVFSNSSLTWWLVLNGALSFGLSKRIAQHNHKQSTLPCLRFFKSTLSAKTVGCFHNGVRGYPKNSGRKCTVETRNLRKFTEIYKLHRLRYGSLQQEHLKTVHISKTYHLPISHLAFWLLLINNNVKFNP